MRIVRKLAVFLLIAGPVGALVGITEASGVNTVNENTTTALTSVPSSPQTYGGESGTLTATVTDAGGGFDGQPYGTVSFTANPGSNTICSASTDGGTGISFTAADQTTYTCTIPAGTTIPAGSYTNITATYTPETGGGQTSSDSAVNYQGSSAEDIGAPELLVNPEAVTPTITLSIVPGTVDAGNESAAVFTVTVTGASGEGSPEGTPTLNFTGVGGTCTLPALSPATGDSSTSTCSPTNSQYAAGATYSFTASYPGGASTNGNFTYNAAGPSSPATLTVNTASNTTTTLAAIVSPVTFGSEDQTFSVTVTGASGDGHPLGTVTVKTGSTNLCTPVTWTAVPSTDVVAASGDAVTVTCAQTNNSLLAASGTGYPVIATFTPGSPSSDVAFVDYSGSFSAPQTLQVNGSGALAITTTSLPNGSPGVSYSATVNTTGGTPPLTWTWAFTAPSTETPPGLGINAANGTISGIPTATGTFTFTVTVTDSTSPTPVSVHETYTITISSPLVITTGSRLPSANRAKNYSTTLAVTGGVGPYTWAITSGSAPGSIRINSSTGVLSGEAGGEGTFTFTVTVTDSSSPHASTSKTFTISVS